MTEILAISRWIYFASVFALFGSSFFWFYIGLWPGHGLPRSFRATLLVLRIAAVLAAFSGLAWLAGIIANMTGGFENVFDPATLHAFFLETPFGSVAILRLVLFAAVLAVALLPLRNRAWFLAMLGGAALLLVSQAWFGHAAEGGATPYGALLICVYAVHMFAGAAWVGGLVPLLFVLVETWPSQKVAEQSFALLSRYSLMGMFAVTLILASGAANVAFHAVSPGKLAHGAYGEVLLVKLLLVAGMLAFAYFNRFVAMPRLRAPPSKEKAYRAKLRASISCELALGIFVLAAASVLGITPPPQ